MKSRWKSREQALFITRLNGLIQKGYSLDEAIRFLSLQIDKKKRADLQHCLEELKRGIPFFQIMHQLKFQRDVVTYLFFAEQHGDLAFSLNESAELLQRKQDQYKKIEKMLRYPVLLILIMFGVLYIVQHVIAPQFLSVYDSMNMKPSFLNTVLFGSFQFISAFASVLPVIAVLCSAFYFLSFRKMKPSKQMGLLMRIPLLREGLKLFNSYYISLQLSNLLKGGLSYYESLLIFKEQSLHPFFSEEANRMIARLKNGEHFEGLFDVVHYDPQLREIAAYGQKNGRLHRELYTYSQYTLTRLESALSAAAAVIQPVIFSVVGLIVLLVYLSMILPMYQMINQI
ncbi:type II secretion system F family protein [Bacillus sp. FJAT-42376]|uniref:competence type IV pilus assembly protein ComGB n=1 Tax=Bacillus sp. FJAT-42376 TaxID=2014076 RepID=UPI000F4FBCCF|nr:competence type IV pilus assembly protein ComGB [Bacillus sp. FJAT-42376]AZB43604.1 type II secretion system F family protein [Bacillus sp. FJAT-42376]